MLWESQDQGDRDASPRMDQERGPPGAYPRHLLCKGPGGVIKRDADELPQAA